VNHIAVPLSAEEMLRLNVKPEEYIDKLVEYCNMKIYAIATVVDTNETWGEEDDFQVLKPNLDIAVSANPTSRRWLTVRYTKLYFSLLICSEKIKQGL
jgi:transglutaminase 1